MKSLAILAVLGMVCGVVYSSQEIIRMIGCSGCRPGMFKYGDEFYVRGGGMTLDGSRVPDTYEDMSRNPVLIEDGDDPCTCKPGGEFRYTLPDIVIPERGRH